MNIQALLTTLPMMLKGMLGVFIVIAAIMLSIYILNKIPAGKSE